MTNNIPVNGWPQLKDLEAVQPTLDRLDKIEAWKRTVKEETFTGDDITIENALALPARSLITSINAIQDLHGYDHPWAEGAGKNKLPMTVEGIKSVNQSGTWDGNVYTWNGNTFEILTDSANNVIGIKVGGNNNGTACRFQLCDEGFIGDGSYYLNGSSADFSGGQTQLYTKYSASDYAVSYNGADTPFTISGGYTIGGVYILVDANITFSSPIIYKPMIRLSTESDATFAPYSNICPISGRTAAVITRSDGDEISEDFTIQLGTTVYGADINWDTGVMTVKTTKQTLNSDLTWVRGGGGSIPAGRAVYYFTEGLIGAKPCGNDDNSNNITMKSNVYNIANKSYNAMRLETGFALGIGGDSNSSTIGCNVSSADIPDASAFETWLDSNPIEIEYPLATPTTIQLTPTQLQMLKGYNRVTLSDGYGTIELKALTGANWS